MIQAEVSTYVEETHTFLMELQEYFKNRITTFEEVAVAKTRYLSAFLDRIALANIIKSTQKLEKYKAALSKSEHPDDELQAIANKTTAYLERIEEYISRRSQTTADTAKFIPVPFHVNALPIIQEKAEACSALIAKHSSLVSKNNNKSWLGRYLTLAHYFIDAYSASFGLTKTAMFKKDMSKEEQVAISQSALTRLNEISAEINALGNERTLTKTSQSLLVCASHDEEPTSEFYHNYFPQEAPPKALAFAARMQIAPQDGSLTSDDLHGEMNIEFPTPVERPALG